MGLDGRQPGRGQGNNGVFQLHETLLSFHDDDMPRKTSEAPSGGAATPQKRWFSRPFLQHEGEVVPSLQSIRPKLQ